MQRIKGQIRAAGISEIAIRMFLPEPQKPNSFEIRAAERMLLKARKP
jgi:hypothetical protein